MTGHSRGSFQSAAVVATGARLQCRNKAGLGIPVGIFTSAAKPGQATVIKCATMLFGAAQILEIGRK